MTRETAEAWARPFVALAFVVLLGGLSLQLAESLHPAVGWAVPCVVAGVIGWRLLDRWNDRRELVTAAQVQEKRTAGEPFVLPDMDDAPPPPLPPTRPR